MQKEIGSSFWLPPGSVSGFPHRSMKSPAILNAGENYLSTCRSAIGMILDSISSRRKVAMAPAFTCESVLYPFVRRGYEVEPYPIGLDLNINRDDFKEKVNSIKPSVILLHSYFGFNTINGVEDFFLELRQQGTILIEDMTQSMFSSFRLSRANYYVGSIRKWMSLPDGAFVTVPLGYSVINEDDVLVEAKVRAMEEKGNWILNGVGDKATFRQSLANAERILDSRDNTYLMSSVSRELYAATDIEKMKEVRWLNYSYLESNIWKDDKLSDVLTPIMPQISDEVCPFHFPVLVRENRNDLQQYLAANDIYATIIWSIPEVFKNKINEIARYVYDHILCFHVDQRYTSEDMKRIVDTLKQYYTN